MRAATGPTTRVALDVPAPQRRDLRRMAATLECTQAVLVAAMVHQLVELERTGEHVSLTAAIDAVTNPPAPRGPGNA